MPPPRQEQTLGAGRARTHFLGEERAWQAGRNPVSVLRTKRSRAVTPVGGGFLQPGPLLRPGQAKAGSRSGRAGPAWATPRACSPPAGVAWGGSPAHGGGSGPLPHRPEGARTQGPPQLLWLLEPEACVRACVCEACVVSPRRGLGAEGGKGNPCRPPLSRSHRPPEGTEAVGGRGAQLTCQALWGGARGMSVYSWAQAPMAEGLGRLTS